MNRDHVKFLLSAFATLFVLFWLAAGVTSQPSAREQAQYRTAADLQAQKIVLDNQARAAWSRSPGNLTAYHQLEARASAKLTEWIDGKNIADRMRQRRVGTSNFYFYAGLFCCLVWLPAVLYLFLRPVPEKST